MHLVDIICDAVLANDGEIEWYRGFFEDGYKWTITVDNREISLFPQKVYKLFSKWRKVEYDFTILVSQPCGDNYFVAKDFTKPERERLDIAVRRVEEMILAHLHQERNARKNCRQQALEGPR